MKTRTRARTRPGIECLEARSLLSGTGYELTSCNGNAYNNGEAVVVQPSDSKVVVVGQTVGADNRQSSGLSRSNTDGSPDTTFGGTGQVVTTWTAADVGVRGATPNVNTQAVVIQPDGKIVTAGIVTWSTRAGSYSDFAVARYNPNGSLDTTFNHTGKVATPIGLATGGADAYSVALETVNGVTKIVAAGQVYDGTAAGSDFALIRYNLDGSLDTSFGGTGKVVTDFFGGTDSAHGVVIQPDGKIIAAGVATDASNNQSTALARYNTDGSLDTTFGGGTGKEALPNTPNAKGVALQPNGKIDVVGTVANTTIINGHVVNLGDDFEFVQFNTDGSLDTSFGTAGRSRVDVGSDDLAYAITIQANPNLPDYGDIMAAGQTYPVTGGGPSKFAVVRVTPNGSLDSTFGTGGIVTLAAGAYSKAQAIALQPDGKIIVAGVGEIVSGSGVDYFAVARFNPDGSLDTTFGPNGPGQGVRRAGVVANHRSLGSAINGRTLQPGGPLVGATTGIIPHSSFVTLPPTSASSGTNVVDPPTTSAITAPRLVSQVLESPDFLDTLLTGLRRP